MQKELIDTIIWLAVKISKYSLRLQIIKKLKFELHMQKFKLRLSMNFFLPLLQSCIASYLGQQSDANVSCWISYLSFF